VTIRPTGVDWRAPIEAERVRVEMLAHNGTKPAHEVTETTAPLWWRSAAEHAASVDTAVPPGWLARPVWPADAYGIIAAAAKAGKTWLGADLAVSVASGTPWLGMFSCDAGGVMACLGEGGARKMLRRLRAICADRDLTYEELPIGVCLRAPHLSSGEHLDAIRAELAATRPRLLLIDPLYLAARGARASALYEMGEVLEGVQLVAQQAGCALVVVHHWNQTGTGRGAERMSGAGPAEWGRVLVSVAVVSSHVDSLTKETAVTLDIDFVGDEIPDTEVRVRRRVRADDPDDLSSALHYQVEALERHASQADGEGAGGLRPSARRVLAALRASDHPLTVQAIGDAVAEDATGLGGLKARTIQDATVVLREAGLALEEGSGAGLPGLWRTVEAPEPGTPHGTPHDGGLRGGKKCL